LRARRAPIATTTPDDEVCRPCGRVVNPGLVAAQLESAVVFGLSAALKQQITLREGRVQETNFHTYRALRMFECPRSGTRSSRRRASASAGCRPRRCCRLLLVLAVAACADARAEPDHFELVSRVSDPNCGKVLRDRRPIGVPSTSLANPKPHATETEHRLANVLRLLAIADRESSHVRDELAREVRHEFRTLVRMFDADLRGTAAAAVDAFVARVREPLMPIMRRAENGWRWYAKPRGYAGDFATIARMYDDEPLGITAVDRLIDRCFLDFPAVIAVQNRRTLVGAQIRRTVERGGARITSLACGPARELFDFMRGGSSVKATLVDFDTQALAHCAAQRASHGLDAQVELVEANLIHVATGRRALELPLQDLVYSIGLIDYLNDDLVVALLDWIHETLKPGGRVLLGNFHPANPTRAIMDHLLDWKLVHRDEAAMHRLAERSKFARPWERIEFEDEHINLFAELRR
jgi:SAM-dependent methyltransferase